MSQREPSRARRVRLHDLLPGRQVQHPGASRPTTMSGSRAWGPAAPNAHPRHDHQAGARARRAGSCGATPLSRLYPAQLSRGMARHVGAAAAGSAAPACPPRCHVRSAFAGQDPISMGCCCGLDTAPRRGRRLTASASIAANGDARGIADGRPPRPRPRSPTTARPTIRASALRLGAAVHPRGGRRAGALPLSRPPTPTSCSRESGGRHVKYGPSSHTAADWIAASAGRRLFLVRILRHLPYAGDQGAARWRADVIRGYAALTRRSVARRACSSRGVGLTAAQARAAR